MKASKILGAIIVGSAALIIAFNAGQRDVRNHILVRPFPSSLVLYGPTLGRCTYELKPAAPGGIVQTSYVAFCATDERDKIRSVGR